MERSESSNEVHPRWEQAADAMARALATGERADAEAAFADDAVVWHNFDGVELDRDRLIATTAGLRSSVPDLTVEVVARLGTPVGFVQQQVLRGRAPGGELVLHSCLVATVDAEGRISRLDEYLDTAQSRPLRAPRA